MIYTLYWMTKV